MSDFSHPTVHALRATICDEGLASVTDAQLRAAIARLLNITPTAFREWSTRMCPDCRADTLSVAVCDVTGSAHLPPLYYALAPETARGDMPLGIGVNSTAALNDLLWNVKADLLLDDIYRA